MYVKNEIVEDYSRNALGTAYLQSRKYKFPVCICIANALQKTFPNANILLFNSEVEINKQTEPIIIIDNYKVRIRQGWVDASVCVIESNIKCINLNCPQTTVEVKEGGGRLLGFGHPLHFADTTTEKACTSIAEQVANFFKEK